MNKKWLTVACALLAIIGAFLPIAGAGGLYANLHHLGGSAYLLYALPIILMALAVVNVYKPIPHSVIWFGGISIAGLLLTASTTMSAMGHVNSFLQTTAEFEERSRQFSQAFDKAWGSFDDGNPQAVKGEPVESRQTPAVPAATPSKGSILLALAFIGAGLMNVRRVTVGQAVLALVIAMVPLLPQPVEAAGKKAVKKVEKQLPEAPRPFGLVLGSTSSAETIKVLESEGGKITQSGNRIIQDDISNPEVTAYFLDGVAVPGAKQTRTWFMKDRLMQIDYKLTGTYVTYHDQLRVKYGNPSYVKEDGFDAEAHWKFQDVDLYLSESFGGGASMRYVHLPLYEQMKASDTRVYQEATRQKAKTQKGF